MINKNNFSEIDNKKRGYFISKIDIEDLAILKNLIEKHFKKIINENYTQKDISFDNYLIKADQAKHGSIFTKSNRVLPKNLFNIAYKELKIFKELKNIFSDFEITDEEKLGYGNFYWRLVRPYPFKDVGPMHKDKWFWDLGSGKIDEKKLKRYKLWISIVGDKSLGFKFVDGSPYMDLKYSSEFRDGIYKPNFDEKIISNKITSLKGSEGTFILFHDELLHGGEVLTNNALRVSIECTFTTSKF